LAKTLRFAREHLNALVGLALVVALMGTYLAKEPVSAHHEPANKFAAAGASIDDVSPNEDHVVLRETMKVSTPFDLALSATAECSILTYLRTSNPTTENPTANTANAEGRVTMWVTLDGNRVPVQTNGVGGPDNGEVSFCNREYQRTVDDTENPLDGIDEERDFIRTRNANGFNWFALDVGRDYDEASYAGETGENIIVVELWARYYKEGAQPCQAVTVTPTTDPPTPVQEDCSDAFIGKRTLVAEPTNASVHEQVNPGPGAGYL
jgi:hypothetical protein